jgi:hypothetical protein
VRDLFLADESWLINCSWGSATCAIASVWSPASPPHSTLLLQRSQSQTTGKHSTTPARSGRSTKTNNMKDTRRVSLEPQSRRVLTGLWSLTTGKPRFQQSSDLAGPFGSSAHGSPLNVRKKRAFTQCSRTKLWERLPSAPS